jgi:hypothetical protein
MRYLLCYTFIITLFSCSSIPVEPLLNSEPIITTKLDDYWLSTNDKQPSRLNRAQLKQLKEQNVKIIASYLIDSNGDVYDVNIIKTNTDENFTKLIRQSLQKRNFSPSPENLTKQPVYATSVLEFTSNK